MTPHQIENAVVRSRHDAARLCGQWQHLTMSDVVAELVEKLQRVDVGRVPLADLPYAIFTAIDAGDRLGADVIEADQLQSALARAHLAAERDLPADYPRDRLLRGMAALSQFLQHRSENRPREELDGTEPARLLPPAPRMLRRYAELDLFLADPRDQRDEALVLAHDLRRFGLELIMASRAHRARPDHAVRKSAERAARAA